MVINVIVNFMKSTLICRSVMPNVNIYLPADLNDKRKKLKLNFSRFVREKLIEVLDKDDKCPMCGRLLPEK